MFLLLKIFQKILSFFCYKEKRITYLSNEDKNKFNNVLNNIAIILADNKIPQVSIIYNLIELLKKNYIQEFCKEINSENMWGGSGAVWEIYIENNDKYKKFTEEIINIIDLMEKTEILNCYGIKSIRNYLKKNFNNI